MKRFTKCADCGCDVERKQTVRGKNKGAWYSVKRCHICAKKHRSELSKQIIKDRLAETEGKHMPCVICGKEISIRSLTGKCDTCRGREYRATYEAKHPNRMYQYKKKWRDNNYDYDLKLARERHRERWRNDPEYRENCLKSSSEWKARNKKHCDDYVKKYQKENHTLILKREQEKRDSLCNAYVRECLRIIGFANEQITPEVISAHRVLIKLKRAIKEKEKANADQ